MDNKNREARPLVFGKDFRYSPEYNVPPWLSLLLNEDLAIRAVLLEVVDDFYDFIVSGALIEDSYELIRSPREPDGFIRLLSELSNYLDVRIENYNNI